MATKRTGPLSFLGSGDVYDPDRLAYDQQKLRQFYLTQGYADFRVVSAVAELTPDKKDFIITYVVEEGPRYKFGDVKVESGIRDLKAETLTRLVPMKKGQWYNAKQVEDTVDRAQRDRRPVRLCLRGRRAGIPARQRTSHDGGDLPGRRDAAQSMSSGSTSTATR